MKRQHRFMQVAPFRRYGPLLALLLLGFVLLVQAARRATAVPSDVDWDFGEGGVAVTDLGGADAAYAAAVGPDGTIVSAGTSDARGEKFNLVVARHDARGQLDATFGEGGVAFTDLGGTDVAYALAVQPDGRVVVAGVSDRGDARELVLLRYTNAGELDPDFGSNGVVRISIGLDYPVSLAVALAPDGSIFLAGHVPGEDGYRLQLMRFTAGGSRDTAFGDGGVVTLPFAGAEGALALTIAVDGAPVIAGSSRGDGGVALAIARFSLDGGLAPWPSDTAGVLWVSLGDHRATGLMFGGDGALAVSAYFVSGGRHSLFLSQTNGDGAWDLVADTGGREDPAVGTTLAEPFAVALQPDGRALVAGAADGDLAIRRYAGLAVPQASATSSPRPAASSSTALRPTSVRTPPVLTRTPAPPATTSPSTATPSSGSPTPAVSATAAASPTAAATAPPSPTPPPTVPPTPPPTAPPTPPPTSSPVSTPPLTPPPMRGTPTTAPPSATAAPTGEPETPAPTTAPPRGTVPALPTLPPPTELPTIPPIGTGTSAPAMNP
jgi:uncharacterized delta-60 repeat protein